MESPLGLLHRRRREPSSLQRQPFRRDDSEGIRLGVPIGQALHGWIDTVGAEPASLVPLLPRAGQRHVGVLAKRQQLLPTMQAVLESPKASTGRRDLQV